MTTNTLQLLNSPNPQDILIGLALRKFISPNHITMIKGGKYNWEKQSLHRNGSGPIILSIYLESFGNYIRFNWHIQENKYLYLSSNQNAIKLYCKGIDEAENVVSMFIEANTTDLGMLYVI